MMAPDIEARDPKTNSTIRLQIFEVLKQEYQQEIHPAKGQEEEKDAVNQYSVGFADITVWFYKRNSQQSLEEARHVWDLLPSNPLQRHNLVDYLGVYTNQILDKHERYSYYQQKYKKVEKIINRTQGLIETFRETFEKIASPQGENPKNTGAVDESIKFSVYLSSLENISLDPAHRREGFVGYHVELGYKDSVACSAIKAVNGKQVDFQNRKLELTFSIKEGSIFVNLYEDYKENGETKKVLAAKRNLDLFTNVSEKYLNDMFSFNNDDIELSADYDEIRFQPFYLKKIETFENNPGPKDKKEDENAMTEDFVRLNMAILIENYRRYEDLQVYYRTLIKRKEYLELKMRGIKMKAASYKKKLTLMLLPFNEIITFNEKSIFLGRKTDKKQQSKHRNCNMF